MVKNSIAIFDMHVDPLVQADLFDYAIDQRHDLNWQPDFGHNRVLWNLIRNFACNPDKSPMFNHVDIPRMLDANYRGAAFGIVLPKLFREGAGSLSGPHARVQENGRYSEDIDLPIEMLQNRLVYSQDEEYNQTLLNTREGGKLSITVMEHLKLFDHLAGGPDSRVYKLKEPEQFEDSANSERLGIFPTLEGAHCLDGLHRERHGIPAESEKEYLEELEYVYTKFGIRYVTLHHFVDNDLGYCSLRPLCSPSSQHNGHLEDLGTKVVRKMHALGIIVDLAHTCTQAIVDACAVQKLYLPERNSTSDGDRINNIPCIASHTVSRSAYKELVNKRGADWNYRESLWWYRGLEDQSIAAIAETGGVIGVSVCPKHLHGNDDATAEHWAYHCHRICDIIEEKLKGSDGKKHLAIGTDFDGWIPSLPDGVRDCRDIGRLMTALNSVSRKRRFDIEDIENLCYRNFITAWKKVRLASMNHENSRSATMPM